MDIPCLYTARPAHHFSQVTGLSSGSRTAVKDLLAPFRRHGETCEHAAAGLYGKVPRQVIRVPGDVHRAGDPPGMGKVRFLLFPDLLPKQGLKRGVVHPQEVRPQRPAFPGIPVFQDLLSFAAPVRPKPPDHPLRCAEPDGIGFIRVRFRIRQRDLVLFPDQVPENAVAYAFQPGHAVFLA